MILSALLYALAPAVGMTLAGLAAARWQPGAHVRGYIQHFAAGVVFAAVGVEVLPAVIHRYRPLAAAAGFAVGVIAMLAIRRLSRAAPESQDAGSGRTPWSLMTAVGVDVVVDGILIGVGFAAGRRQGILLAVALTGCAVSLGLATSAALLRAGDTPRRAAGLTARLALLPPIGAAVGAAIAMRLTGAWMEAVLSFTCAALLYLVTEELLVEAHEEVEGPETPLMTAVLFIGFLALLMIDMLL